MFMCKEFKILLLIEPRQRVRNNATFNETDKNKKCSRCARNKVFVVVVDVEM